MSYLFDLLQGRLGLNLKEVLGNNNMTRNHNQWRDPNPSYSRVASSLNGP
jgi:hypothetical protein